MKRNNLDQIKSLESPPKIVNIFSEKEIKMMQELYALLPEKVFNKKQNVRKKMWAKIIVAYGWACFGPSCLACHS